MKEWEVPEADSGIKLIAFLGNVLGTHSRRKIKEALEKGNCTVNGRIERFSNALLGYGDRVRFENFDTPSPGSEIALISLYEDEHLFICSKPSGMHLTIRSFLGRFGKKYPSRISS